MNERFYLDTSIWLDFFENRDEPNMPKSDWARELIANIISGKDIIVFSDINLIELCGAGYLEFDIEDSLQKLRLSIIKVEATEKQLGVAGDLAFKRDVPRGDALHALIARDYHAVLVTLDHDFRKLTDIIQPYRTNELI